MTHSYDDIIHLPHHVSAKRAHMSLHARAAQFAPFAALTGYEASIAEAARWTSEKIELDEDGILMLDERLREIAENIKDRPEAEFCYFVKDSRKAGGAYKTVRGKVKKIDGFERLVLLENGLKIGFDDLYSAEFLPSSPP